MTYATSVLTGNLPRSWRSSPISSRASQTHRHRSLPSSYSPTSPCETVFDHGIARHRLFAISEMAVGCRKPFRSGRPTLVALHRGNIGSPPRADARVQHVKIPVQSH